MRKSRKKQVFATLNIFQLLSSVFSGKLRPLIVGLISGKSKDSGGRKRAPLINTESGQRLNTSVSGFLWTALTRSYRIEAAFFAAVRISCCAGTGA